MAETKTTTRGRKAKSQVEQPIEKTNEVDQSDLIQKLMAQIDAQNKAMAELQAKVNQQPIIVQQDSGFSGKKIKCINLMYNPVNISTEPNGQGRVYTFEKYGESRMIKFDELSDIVASYPYTMENGLIYICNPEVVEIFGLSDDYAKLYTKDVIDKITYLREEEDLEMFLGMEKHMQESIAVEIAKLLNSNERMDYNYLRRIKEECNLDIELIAKELKENESKASANDLK